MRHPIVGIRVICLGCALAPSVAAAQYPNSPLPQNLTPISVEEPRAFPQTHSPAEPPHRIQPPVNVRLVSAEEPKQLPPSKPPLKLAPRSASTRQSSARPAAPSPASALTTVAGSLGAVLAIFMVIVWCSRRFAPVGNASLPTEAVELLGRSPLAGRQQMHLIRIGNKLLLVAISPVGMETLTELTDTVEVERLLSLCKGTSTTSASAAFQQALTQLASEPAPRGFVGSARTTSRGAT